MEIKLTPEQVEELLKDQWADIILSPEHRIYVELDRDNRFWYFEMVKSLNGKTEQGYANDITELEKLYHKKPRDPSYWHNDPLCPSCGTYMIYHFEHCPKCGQKIDWSEE